MTKTIQNPIIASRSESKARSLCLLDRGAGLERSDHRAGREYLPMDVFVDPKTIRRHFQGASIRARWCRLHTAAA